MPRQFCTPHFLANGTTTALLRVPFDERTFDEDWFQDILFRNPSLLPVDEIEPLFAPLVPLARELATPAGPVDIVYITADGYLTLVETKLWRNPEARRQVVAQIIDYAAAMSRWTYEDLCEAVAKSGRGGDDPVAAVVAEDPDFDRARFVDTVSRGLQKGRFLLLIVGDGIQEGVEHLAETLSRSPHLSFSLALVEMAVFRTVGNGAEYFIQPRTLARTREVVRAVVELKEGIRASDVQVSLPAAAAEGRPEMRRDQALQVFLETLGRNTSTGVAEAFRQFLGQCTQMGIELTGKGASVGLFWFEPTRSDRFTFGSVYAVNGFVEVNYVPMYFQKWGLDPTIGERYIAAVTALVPGARVASDVKDGRTWVRVLRSDGYNITVSDLLPKLDQWLEAIRAMMREVQEAEERRAAETA